MNKISACEIETCSKLATVRVSYALYRELDEGVKPHVLHLCAACSKVLWDGENCVPLKNLVAAGLAYYCLEKIE